MIKLIQAACQWGQKDFDGWVIGKARYCIHSHSEPVSCESIPQKAAQGYVLLETTSYDACRRPCQQHIHDAHDGVVGLAPVKRGYHAEGGSHDHGQGNGHHADGK